ncbi:MAG: biotin/lipoyl-binding protein, partial [Moraxellaceae bacterium]
MNSAYTHIFSRRSYQLTLAAILSGIAGFYYVTNVHAATPAAVPAATPVDVVVVQPQQIRAWASFSGRLSPVESAAIKPLVSGTIQQVLFKDGQQVKKGQPLFVIDPRPH